MVTCCGNNHHETVVLTQYMCIMQCTSRCQKETLKEPASLPIQESFTERKLHLDLMGKGSILMWSPHGEVVHYSGFISF